MSVPGAVDHSALVFLDDPMARRLAVAWQFLGDDKSATAWAAAAGVPEYAATTFGPPLRSSGVCRDDGKTDPLALQYVTTVVVGAIAAKKKKPPASS